MGAERITFDTNILFYALDPDAGEKHKVAHDLLDRALDSNPVLLLQSLAELYNAARKRQTIPLDQVRDFIADNMNALPVVAFEQAESNCQPLRCNACTSSSSGTHCSLQLPRGLDARYCSRRMASTLARLTA